MNLFLILPLLIPLSTAVAALLAWKWPAVQRVFSLVGAAGLLAASAGLLNSVCRDGIQAVQIGDWPAPFGITLVVDLFSGIMVVLAGLVGLAIAVYSLANMDPQRESFGYYPLLHILLMGVCGSFVTGDIFNLYVWFEVMLIASFVLLELGGEKAQLEGTIKYVAMNLLSSALFLTAIALLYGATGKLNMADLAQHLRMSEPSGLVTTIAFLFFLAFGIKAAIFPLFFWLPASYHTPPVAISAVFAGLLTKVGVYASIRFFTLIFVQDTGTTHPVILIAAGLTMVTGGLGAVAQKEFRRILSFHIVSQIGYMILGLGIFTRLALTASIFHIMHNIIVKTNLFLVSGVTYRLQGTYELKKTGGICKTFPALAILFLISALALSGVPPLSGFWSKFLVIKAGLEVENYIIVATAFLVGMLTLFSMTKIWNEVFWKDPPVSENSDTVDRNDFPGFYYLVWSLIPIVALVVLTLAIGLVTGPFLALIENAAEQLMNPAGYIRAVLGGSP